MVISDIHKNDEDTELITHWASHTLIPDIQ